MLFPIKMVTLKEYKAYLKVKRFIDGHKGSGRLGVESREAEIISRLMGDNKYVPLIIESDGTDPIKYYCNISDISVTNIPKCSICTRLPSRDVSSACLASWLISYDLVLSSLCYSFSLYNITW